MAKSFFFLWPLSVYTVITLFAIYISGCAGNQQVNKSTEPETEPIANRILVQRPGLGEQLDKQIASLVLENKRQQALRLCNDILFSSRSKEDREIAYYWRTFVTALDELDNKEYKKVIEIFEKGAKWWQNPSRIYHIQVLTQMVEIIIQQQKTVRQLQNRSRDLEKAEEYRMLNEQLTSELLSMKRKNEELERLLLKLENK